MQTQPTHWQVIDTQEFGLGVIEIGVSDKAQRVSGQPVDEKVEGALPLSNQIRKEPREAKK